MPCVVCAVSPCEVQLCAGKPGNHVPLVCIAPSSTFPCIARATVIGLETHAVLGNNYFHFIISSVPAAGTSVFGPNKSNLPGPLESELYLQASPPGARGGPCPARALQPPQHPSACRGAEVQPRHRRCFPGLDISAQAFLPGALAPAPSLGRGDVVRGGKEGTSDFSSHILILPLAKEIFIKCNL